MKLRTRFVLLIVGGVVVPPLMLGLAVFISFLTLTSPDGPEGIMSMQRVMRLSRSGETTVQSAAEKLDSSHSDLSVFVLDASGTVLFPTERAGTRTQINAIVEEIQRDGSRSTTLLSTPDENGGSGYIIASYQLKDFADHFANVGIVMPLGFVLFMSIMSVLIIRSIRQSIRGLETATRRIAEGDLDFELETSGKDQLASLTRSFDTMRRQLKEQFDRGSRFLMGISHDLKTPLSSITGYIDAIRDGYADTPEKLEKYTAIIHTKTLLLESRISALIDHAKQETREWKASLRPVEIAGFLEEFVSLVEAEALARRFTFRSTIDLGEGLTVEMDPDMVSRALENLAENAFLYATPGSEISIHASRHGDNIVIEVENEGPGIDPEAMPHIFDPLFRAGGDRSGTGFGLGLATVKSVITSHGWAIDVTSDPGHQTVFTVSIPSSEGSSLPGPAS